MLEEVNLNDQPQVDDTSKTVDALTKQIQAKYERIKKELGALFVVHNKSIRANRPAIAKFLATLLGKLVYIGPEDRLYRKNIARGLWEHIPEDLLCTELLEKLIKFARQNLGLDIGYICTVSFARDILRLVKLNCRDDVFFKDRQSILFFIYKIVF